ncbi:MAG TPA: DUF1203 domain-containing protein [Chthoniobacterales bacterium]|jgi:Protein of unknown function (DUF1203).|nr:DUF1203 domain-containing protein [Chthoniobacterales bacterium]
MKTNFRIVGLQRAQFEPLFSSNEKELAAKGARRMTVDAKPGFPCRIGLADAEIGETVILLPFVHHDVDSPYRASGPIFVRENSKEAQLAPGEVPELVSCRTISVRAYDHKAAMIDGAVVAGPEMKAQIEKLFANLKIEYLHLHNAGAGCYSCKVERVAD